MLRTIRFMTSLMALTACARPDAQRTRDQARVCATPAGGIVISRDRIGSFSTHATLGALKRKCGAGDSTMYDGINGQAAAWAFPFVGARVVAVQSKHAFYEPTRDDEVPDFWTVEGDSVRLPDGQRVPTTLGLLKARYPFVSANDNTGLDDTEPRAWSCQLSYLVFHLDVKDTARHVPDSARVTSIDLVATDSAYQRFCREHHSAAGR
jgi:hypothetical protein